MGKLLAIAALGLLPWGCPAPEPAVQLGTPSVDADVHVETSIAGDSAAPTPDVAGPEVAPAKDTVDDADASSDASAETSEDTVAPFTWGEPVPMQVVDGLPIVEGTVDDSGPLPFVVDTLSQVIFVDSGIVDTIAYTEATIGVGPLDLGFISVKGRDLSPDASFTGLPVAGLLGAQFLTDRVTVLDYPNRQAYLTTTLLSSPLVPLPSYETAPQHVLKYRLPNLMAVLEPTIGPAGEVALLADTSSRITIVYQRVFDAIAAEAGVALPQLAGYRFATKYAEEPGFVTRLPALDLPLADGSTLTVPNVAAVVLPDDNHLVGLLSTVGVNVEGYLGANVWERFAVAISGHDFAPDDVDHRAMVLWGDGSPPTDGIDTTDHWRRVGVELTWSPVDDAITVHMVYQGTSAQAEGVLIDEVLTAIDGGAVTDLASARASLQGTVGDTRTLTLLDSDGLSREVTVTIEDLLP